jgi:hypothetical protein
MNKLIFIIVFIITAISANAQRTPVKTEDLQKTITDNIHKDYIGFTIKEATENVANNITTYEVVIAKGTTQETLLYDKDGKFLKKTEVKNGTVAKQKPTQPVKKQTPVKTHNNK